MADQKDDKQMKEFEKRIAERKAREVEQETQDAEKLRQSYLKRTGRTTLKP